MINRYVLSHQVLSKSLSKRFGWLLNKCPNHHTGQKGQTLQTFENKWVGFVNDRSVKAGKIYLGRGFWVMSHSFTNYTYGNPLCFGSRSPTMSRNIKGQGNCDTDHRSNLLQIIVDVVSYITIGTSFVSFSFTYYRQQVTRAIFWVSIKNHLHFLCPFNCQPLSGLMTSIGNVAIFKVCLFKKCWTVLVSWAIKRTLM